MASSARATRDLLKVDTAEIVRFLKLSTEPNQIVELRLLHVLRHGQRFSVTMSGYFNDYHALAESARIHGDAARGVYVTLNPMNPALLARAANRLRIVERDDPLTGDSDITKRRWLPIDLDPVRPSGISSSKEEHQRAVEKAFHIRNTLRGEGWPAPLVGDSGNGAHLLYSVDLPVNDGDIVKGWLQEFARRFDDDSVKVDQAVFNPARIWKLYGTVSRKGDNLPDRPHRLARILEEP
jgi:hypothetical protein